MPSSSALPLQLKIRGLGSVPSFKNSKMLTRGRLITDPKKQQWMTRAQASLELQLLSAYPTGDSGTATAEKLRSWIRSATPENDSCRYLTRCCWSFITVPKDDEGADIEIARQ